MTNSTASSFSSVGKALDSGDPNIVSDALRMIKLGTILTPIVYDTGVVVAAATVTLNPPALLVQSVQVVTDTAGGIVGNYMAGDAGCAPVAAPQSVGVPTGIGICALSADGTTLTLPTADTATEVVVSYIPRPAKDLASWFFRA
jgi:hypothetical protein